MRCSGVPGWCVYPLSGVVLISVPPLRRVTFGKGAPKVTKRSSSRFGPPSSDSLTPATLRGHAAIGHPWPGAASAASMPRCPLRAACVRPAPKSRFVVYGLAWVKIKSICFSAFLLFCFGALYWALSQPRSPLANEFAPTGFVPCRDLSDATKCDFGRPSAGVA
jgi:hypothetical protein